MDLKFAIDCGLVGHKRAALADLMKYKGGFTDKVDATVTIKPGDDLPVYWLPPALLNRKRDPDPETEH